jgi:hypothetical protein
MIAIILVFYFTQPAERVEMPATTGNVYQTDELAEVTISAAMQSDNWNLLVTLTVGGAA